MSPSTPPAGLLSRPSVTSTSAAPSGVVTRRRIWAVAEPTRVMGVWNLIYLLGPPPTTRATARLYQVKPPSSDCWILKMLPAEAQTTQSVISHETPAGHCSALERCFAKRNSPPSP